MKKGIIGIIMVLGLALVLVSGCGGGTKKVDIPPPTELLTNGGFETGSLDPWTPDFGVEGDWSVVDAATTAPHSGSYSCMVTNRTAEWHSVEQNIVDTLNDLGPGTYHVKFWAKLPAGIQQDFYVDVLYKTDESQQWSTENTTAHVLVGEEDNTWVLVSGNVDLNWSGTLYSSTITFKTYGGSVAPTVFIDDFSMTKVD